jgi:RND family efflux transporter MFP subunit
MLRKKNFPMGMTLMLALALIAGCQKAAEDAEVKVPVSVETVSLGTVRQYLGYNGDIKAELEVNVFSKIPDRIEAYFVDEGDAVQAGSTIAKVMATTIEQAVLQAEAYKNNVEMEYSRAQRLSKENAMSQQQYDAIQTQMVQAQASLVSAKSQLKDATITAPISGIIAKRYFEAGDMASPGMPVVSVVQMNNVKIEFDATESDLGRLAVGQKADVRVPSYSDQVFTGKVIKISPILDPMTRMATVEVLVPNRDHLLKPGMYAEVEITTGVLENAIVVPRHAVIESTSLESENGKEKVVRNYFVYVVNDSMKAEQRELTVDYVNHSVIAVKDGIRVGEKLVVSGQNNLRDGLSVAAAE